MRRLQLDLAVWPTLLPLCRGKVPPRRVAPGSGGGLRLLFDKPSTPGARVGGANCVLRIRVNWLLPRARLVAGWKLSFRRFLLELV